MLPGLFCHAVVGPDARPNAGSSGVGKSGRDCDHAGESPNVQSISPRNGVAMRDYTGLSWAKCEKRIGGLVGSSLSEPCCQSFAKRIRISCGISPIYITNYWNADQRRRTKRHAVNRATEKAATRRRMQSD